MHGICFNISIKYTGNIVIVLIVLSFPYGDRMRQSSPRCTDMHKHPYTFVLMMAFMNFITRSWTNKCWMQDIVCIFNIQGLLFCGGLCDAISSTAVIISLPIAHCPLLLLSNNLNNSADRILCYNSNECSFCRMHFMFKWLPLAGHYVEWVSMLNSR